jgi:hypothetical protein
MSEQSLYYLESFVPSWLTQDAGYVAAFKTRLKDLMEMQEFAVDEIDEPFVKKTPDCPSMPGMCVFRVEATVREYDVDVPDEDEEDEQTTWFVTPEPQETLTDLIASHVRSVARGIAARSSQEIR